MFGIIYKVEQKGVFPLVVIFFLCIFVATIYYFIIDG